MKVILLVEGRMDQIILKRLASVLEGGDSLEIMAGGGISYASSLARSLLVERQLPVILLLDADTTDERAIQERKLSLEAYLNWVPAAPTRVILAVPSIEAVLFQDPDILGRHTRPLGEVERVEAQYNPKKVLEQLLQTKGGTTMQALEHLLAELKDSELRVLAEAPPIREIREFLCHLHQDPIALHG